MTYRFLAATALIGLAGCGAMKTMTEPEPPRGGMIAPAPAGPPMSPEALAQHIRILSSDEFAGREPASGGEKLATDYVSQMFQKAGLSPGWHGQWLQPVPLLEATAIGDPGLTITGADGAKTYTYRDQEVMWTKRPRGDQTIASAPLVFVGYGVVAPEQNWNDYAGVDMHGKIAVILVNDPDFETPVGHPTTGKFGGKAMTYYGRWTYKYEEAGRQGAAGAIIIHETAPAAYPWAVVESSWTGPQFDTRRSGDGSDRAQVEGWIHTSTAADIFKRANLNFADLKAAAQKQNFHPVPMNLTGSIASRVPPAS